MKIIAIGIGISFLLAGCLDSSSNPEETDFHCNKEMDVHRAGVVIVSGIIDPSSNFSLNLKVAYEFAPEVNTEGALGAIVFTWDGMPGVLVGHWSFGVADDLGQVTVGASILGQGAYIQQNLPIEPSDVIGGTGTTRTASIGLQGPLNSDALAVFSEAGWTSNDELMVHVVHGLGPHVPAGGSIAITCKDVADVSSSFNGSSLELVRAHEFGNSLVTASAISHTSISKEYSWEKELSNSLSLAAFLPSNYVGESDVATILPSEASITGPGFGTFSHEPGHIAMFAASKTPGTWIFDVGHSARLLQGEQPVVVGLSFSI